MVNGSNRPAPRSETVAWKVTERKKQAIVDAAEAMNLSVSEWLELLTERALSENDVNVSRSLVKRIELLEKKLRSLASF